MRLDNDTERRIFAAAFVQAFYDRKADGIASVHRVAAVAGDRDTVEYWEATLSAQAIDDANAIVSLYRKGLKEWDHE